MAFGSFLNVCISRLPRHQSIVQPGSRCPRCGTAIRSVDNIPVLSWLLLRGRCRSCGKPIAWRYPLVEAATACLFLLCFLTFGLNTEGAGAAVLCFLLLGLAVMDAETMLLPDAFTLPGIALGILYAAILPADSAMIRLRHAGEAALWALAAAALLLAIRELYFLVRRQEGMGAGDVKLLALIAAWMGPELGGVALFLGVLSAAIYGAVGGIAGGMVGSAVRHLPASGRRRPGQARLPLGVFLSAAAICTLFEGQKILNWYLQFFR
nr:A24 family peptidase [Paracidobacterium acidisoli]